MIGEGRQLAHSQEQWKLGEEAHSCGPGTFPSVGRAWVPGPARGKRHLFLPQSQLCTQNTELPWHDHGIT